MEIVASYAFCRIDQFMSLSFAAEPRRKGLFEPYFWSRISNQQSTHPLAALLFPAGMFIYAWCTFPEVPWIGMAMGVFVSVYSSIDATTPV